MPSQWILFFLLFSSHKVFSSDTSEDSVNSLSSDRSNVSENPASEIVKKVIAKGCAKKYTMTCFKMDMVELIDLLSATNTYQLFPGIAVVKDNSSKASSNKKLPEKLIRSLAREFPLGESTQLDEFLINKISDYLSSHSISLKVMDPQFQNLEGNATEGRGKGHKGYGNLMAGVMMMKGTLMTIGFGALAALAGKALMTGLLSLMLSAIIALRSTNGQPQRQTTYEIISKPIYSHSHSHSSEISHDHHDHGHGHSSYSYGRNLDFDDEKNSYIKSEVEYVQLPAKEEEEDDIDRPHQEHYNYNSYGNIEYKTITEDDLRAYYNNLDYKNRGGYAPISYRQGKNLEENAKPPLKFDSSTFIPDRALLKPDLKPIIK